MSVAFIVLSSIASLTTTTTTFFAPSTFFVEFSCVFDLVSAVSSPAFVEEENTAYSQEPAMHFRWWWAAGIAFTVSLVMSNQAEMISIGKSV